jgi:acylphosphatase
MKYVLRSLFAALFFCFAASIVAAQAETTAVSGTVNGKVQQVGFRAMILKQAICGNLAGTARNLDNGTVQFVLQGDRDRIEQALAVIRKGTRKSADVKVVTSPAAVEATLKTFTVIGWTSSSRKITTPYDLVFTIRPDSSSASRQETQKIYRGILKSTLNAEDLKKLNRKQN